MLEARRGHHLARQPRPSLVFPVSIYLPEMFADKSRLASNPKSNSQGTAVVLDAHPIHKTPRGDRSSRSPRSNSHANHTHNRSVPVAQPNQFEHISFANNGTPSTTYVQNHVDSLRSQNKNLRSRVEQLERENRDLKKSVFHLSTLYNTARHQLEKMGGEVPDSLNFDLALALQSTAPLAPVSVPAAEYKTESLPSDDASPFLVDRLADSMF